MRTYVYIDGFNLYYGALKDTPYKWLDLKALFSRILQPYNKILAIKYYTAKVSARPGDPGAPTRQTIYMAALKAHIPELEVSLGHFLQNTVRMRLAKPKPWRKTEEVIKTEEKGSDVNLALHVLNDAWEDRYDCAVICSNDSDLKEALRLVKTQHEKRIVLVVPGDPMQRPTAIQLIRFANAEIRITNTDLAASQLPNPIPGTTLHKPSTW
ncbi:MAG: NYN domain-containing protein [Burkholderiales bacterium]